MRKPYWTRRDIDNTKEIQQQLKEENLCVFKEEWERRVEKLNRIYKDSG